MRASSRLHPPPARCLPLPRRSGSGRAGGRASDAFGGGSLRAGDLPGGGGDDFFDDAAVPMPDEEEEAVGLGGSGFGGGGGGLGGSLSAQFESLLETAPEHTQTQRGPAAALSGVSSGVAKYFAAAFGSAESQDTAFVFKQLCTANR